jgi:hypothetical protein
MIFPKVQWTGAKKSAKHSSRGPQISRAASQHDERGVNKS